MPAMNAHHRTSVATGLTNLFYVSRRIIGIDKARAAVGVCLATFEIIPVGRLELEQADAMAGNDLEDNLSIACAGVRGARCHRDPRSVRLCRLSRSRPISRRIAGDDSQGQPRLKPSPSPFLWPLAGRGNGQAARRVRLPGSDPRIGRDQSGEPVHDVQRELAVVVAGVVHPERPASDTELRREGPRLAEHDDAALAVGRAQALAAADGRTLTASPGTDPSPSRRAAGTGCFPAGPAAIGPRR